MRRLQETAHTTSSSVAEKIRCTGIFRTLLPLDAWRLSPPPSGERTVFRRGAPTCHMDYPRGL